MGAVLSIVMLAALALLGGAFVLWRRDGPSKQAWLMVLLAVVMIANVLIWALPGGSTAPVEQAESGPA